MLSTSSNRHEYRLEMECYYSKTPICFINV
jgi:hypothetical protein